MRQRLAWVFVALTVMLVVGFLVPLGLSLRSQAELRSLAGAQSDARGVATALASSARATSRNPGAIDVQFVLDSFGSEDLVVFLPDGTRLGNGYTPENAVDLADDGAIVARIDGGVLAVVPVTFQTSGARLVVTSFVSNTDLREGVTTSWLILAVLGLIVVVGAVPLADRLAASIVKPVRELSDAAHRWAGGDLDARVAPAGPPEVAESGRAFNQLVERLAELLAAERERIVSDAEADELYEIQLEVGETSPLLVIEDPDRTVGQVHRIHYARFSALKEYKRRNPAQTRWEFEIEEWGGTGNLPYPIGVPLIEFEGSAQSGVLGFDGSEQSGIFVEEN